MFAFPANGNAPRTGGVFSLSRSALEPRAMVCKFTSAVLLAALLARAIPARAQDINGGAVSDEQVSASIKRGVDYLLKIRNADGTWESGTQFIPDVPMHGAETCLVLYALLHVGESGEDSRLSPQSKELAAAVKFVTGLNADTTYVASLQACALALCPKDPPVREAMIRVRNFLMNTTLARGGHTYSVAKARQNPGDFDNSNSNYALMGLAAIDNADVPGVTVPVTYWQGYETFWRRNQNPDGGWGYAPNNRPQSYGTMTAAGMASVLLCREFTQTTDISTTAKPDKTLESAMAALVRQYDPNSENLYYTFTLERIGLAGGFKYVGNLNWYKEGAGVIMRDQKEDGSWQLDSLHTFLIRDTPTTVFTAYALMFLSRGRSPVLFNKLQYDGPWDARQRDDANVTDWITHVTEKPLAWQSVALKKDQDWTDAPVLLITGSRDPKFTADDIALLKAYIDAGGMIFSTADGASEDFSKAMRKYAGMVVEEQHEMRDLAPDHPLLNLYTKIARPPKLEGMSNGVREVWVHSPMDLGAAWQKKAKENRAAFEVAGNLYAYATGRGIMGHRIDNLLVKPSADKPVRTIELARVKYGGNWDPEPGAWPRMVKLAQAQFHTDLHLTTVPAAALDPTKTPIAHMTGTAAIRLDDDAKKGLVDFVGKGGTLFIDACGGNNSFSTSVKDILGGLFKDMGSLEPIPPDSPLYSGAGADSVKLDEVNWRRYTRIRDNATPDDHPRLLGIKKGDRFAVIFSGDDITSGLLGTNTWGIAGYAPKSAQDLARDILLYAPKP